MPFRPSQKTFRARDDSQTLNSSTFTYAVNTNWTQLVDVVFRVRFTVQEVGATAGASTYNLYYSLNGGAYTKVTTSSAPIQYALSGQFADKDATTKVLDGTGTWAAGQGLETSVDTSSISLVASGNTEIEFCLTIPAAGVAHGNTIALRVYRSTSTALYSYTNTPTVTVSEPISGNLSITLDGIGLSAIGVVSVVGSLTKTLDEMTLQATGTVGVAQIIGTLNVTLDAITLNASGTIAIVGNLDKTLGGIELLTSGAVSVAGILSKTLDGIGLSTAGVVSVSGISNITLDGIGISAAGAVGVSGGFTKTLDNMSLASAGVVTVTGVFNKTLDAISLSASGTVGGGVEITGSLDVVLDGISLSSAGSVSIIGLASISLDDITLYSYGVTIIAVPGKVTGRVIAIDRVFGKVQTPYCIVGSIQQIDRVRGGVTTNE